MMSDNEIVKALKHCAKGEHCNTCCFRGITYTVSECSKNFLNLINRLQAENERLQSRNNFLEIEYKNQGNLFWERVNGVKAEAYKEFAERLKTEYAKGMNWFKKKESYYVDVEDIDNLLKEMVGETNE